MKKVRFALIGCGKMMANHLKGMKYVENAEITAVCDVKKENAEYVAASLENGAKAFTDFRDPELLDLVDAVLIALPHDLHYECGMYFSLYGKHLLMEKPLCNTEEECVRLIETCEAQNVKLMCAYPVRYWKGVEKLKELIDSGEYGEIIQMSVWTEQLTGIGADFKKGSPWGRTSRAGGGQLFCHGCHYIDILLWFLGEPVSGTHFGTRNGTPWQLTEGTSAVTIKFKNGAIGYHGATWGARGTRLGYDFQIQTEKGLLEYAHNYREVRLYNQEAVHVPGVVSNMGYDVIWKRDSDTREETQHEIRYFADCVLNDKKPLTDGRSALQGLRVIWALYNAEKNGILADLRGLGLENA